MRQIRAALHIVPAVLCALVLASCGGDESDSNALSQLPEANSGATTIAGEVSRAPAPLETVDGCGRVDGLAIELVAGDVTCEDALAAVSAYDMDGPKRQELEEFTCESGEATTAPVVLTCTGETGEIHAKKSDPVP